MAMLDRYKKTGGFNQLLTLLETCGAQKQQKFLEIIRQEDPRWADALIAKMIDIKRFLSWNDAAIAEVTGAMVELNMAMVISSLAPDQQTRLLETLPHIKRRKVQEHLDGSQKPTAGEVATSMNKLYETIRRLSQEGVLRLDKVDPVLFVDGDIEERLKQGKTIIGVPTAAESLARANASAGVSADEPETPHLKIVTTMDATPAFEGGRDPRAAEQEIIMLKKRVQLLTQENAALRQEVSEARAKLDQIRKLS